MAGSIFLASPAQAKSNQPYVRIVNQSGVRLHIYAAGLREVAQIAPGQNKVLRLPVAFSYQGQRLRSRQLVVFGGGYWKANSSGWTSYRNAKVCTQ